MIGVTDRLEDEAFSLTITHAFTVTGRGTAVIGPIESGLIRNGDTVEVWDGEAVVARGRVQVEDVRKLGADPRTIGLTLGAVDVDLLSPGQIVRHARELGAMPDGP